MVCIVNGIVLPFKVIANNSQDSGRRGPITDVYELGITREYSVTVPFAGDILPIWFLEFSVNQRLPSGPAVIA